MKAVLLLAAALLVAVLAVNAKDAQSQEEKRYFAGEAFNQGLMNLVKHFTDKMTDYYATVNDIVAAHMQELNAKLQSHLQYSVENMQQLNGPVQSSVMED